MTGITGSVGPQPDHVFFYDNIALNRL